MRPLIGGARFQIFEVMNMAKAVTIKVKLVSSADTGFYYVAKKNSRTMTDKLVKKKYDPVAPQRACAAPLRRDSPRWTPDQQRTTPQGRRAAQHPGNTSRLMERGFF